MANFRFSAVSSIASRETEESKLGRVVEQGRCLIQRRHLQIFDLGALPAAVSSDLLVVTEHVRGMR